MAAHRGVYPQDIGCGVQDEADECEPAEARRRGDQGDAELPSEVNQALLPGQCSGMPCLFPGLPVRWWQVRRHAPTNFFYNNWRFLGRTNASLGAGGYTTWSNMPHNKLPPDNDFNRNPRAYFTNRRGTWFDDYTKYRPYVAVPANIPLFQFRDNALSKLRIARGTLLIDGLFFAQVPSAGWHQARGCRNERLGGPRSETAPA